MIPCLLTSVALAAPPATAARALEGLTLTHETVVEAVGAEPRRVVRFRPVPGKKVTFEASTKQDMQMAMVGPDGRAMPMPGMGSLMPTVVLRMSSVVGDPVDGGVTPVTLSYDDARVEGAPASVQDQVKQSMGPLLGTGFRMLVNDATGRIDQIDVSTEDEALYAAMQGLADQYLTQLPTFPDEPIGLGAQWTVTMDMGVGGMDLVTQQTLTVTEITDTTITTDTVFAITRGDQPVQVPGLPPGASVDFERFEGSGKGRYVIDLTTMASRGEMSMDLSLGMAMTMEGQSMKMTMEMSQTSTMRPVD